MTPPDQHVTALIFRSRQNIRSPRDTDVFSLPTHSMHTNILRDVYATSADKEGAMTTLDE